MTIARRHKNGICLASYTSQSAKRRQVAEIFATAAFILSGHPRGPPSTKPPRAAASPDQIRRYELPIVPAAQNDC